MKIPFYQEQWNGINLRQLAEEIGQDPNILPSAKFYEAYYQRVGHKIEQSWLEHKQKQSEWLLRILGEFAHKSAVMLSVGAGTGIVEKPLLKKGMNIDLQDCQGSSFHIFGVDNLTNCFSKSLAEFEEQSYDVIFCVAVTYAMSDFELANFAKHVKRLLKPRGIFIILDTPLSWRDCYVYWRNYKFFQENYMLWGYKRNIQHWKRLMKQLHLINEGFYNDEMHLIVKKTFLGLPIQSNAKWQMGVFQKS